MHVFLIFLIGAPAWVLSGEILPSTNEIDSTIENLLKTFLSPSNSESAPNFHLKSSLASKNSLKWNITAIGTSILNEIKALSEKLGIHTFPRSKNSLKSIGMHQLSPTDSIYYELFSFPYEIIPIFMKTISNCQSQIKRRNYLSRGYIPLKLTSSDSPKFPQNLKTIFLINKSKNYILKFSECLTSKPSVFDVQKAAINVVKYSPEVVGNIVRNRLNKNIPKHPQIRGQRYNEYEAFTCQILTTNNRMFGDCLKELRKIDNCVSRKMKTVKTRNYLSSGSINFIKNIGNLKNCKFFRNLLIIQCKNDSNHRIEIIEVIKNFTGSSIPNNVIQDFGNEIVGLFGNDLGGNFLEEFGTLAYVYDEGLKRQRKLERISGNNSDLRKYERFSESFKSYERNLVTAAVSAIHDVRAVAASVERTLVSSMSKFLGMDLREHLRSIKCLHKLMDVIMGQLLGNGHCCHDDGDGDDDDDDSGGDDQSEKEDSMDKDEVESAEGNLEENGDFWDSLEDDKEEATGNAMSLYSGPMKNLLKSMKRLIKTKIQRNANTIATLANTFLLATMFYECIAILAAAIYRPGSMENPSFPMMIHDDPDEQNDNGPWDGRFTRSLRFSNKKRIDDSLNSSKYINYHNAHGD